MRKEKVQTEEVSYPCPRCGNFEKPYMYSKDGYAYMLCSKCHTQYKTSTAVSANFRKFCSKVGSKPNRSPTYYTSSEEKVRRFLQRRGLLEGLDFFHNARIGPFENGNKRKVYYWIDFVVPSKRLLIECSPSIWHRMWNREEADKRKNQLVEQLGWTIIHLDEKELNQLNKKRKKSKYPKTDNVKKLYQLFGCSEEYEVTDERNREKGQ